MCEMTLEELLEYERDLIRETNNDNADDTLAALNELSLYKAVLSSTGGEK